MSRFIPSPEFGGENFERILQRMMDRIKERDKREGSLIWDSNASTAVELQLLYLALDDILVEAFGDSASREFLIRRARERHIIPFTATYAVLRGVFTPIDIDLIGRRFSMPNTALTYVLERAVDGVAELRCEQAGSEGNHFFGAIIPLWGGNPRVKTIELTELLIPAQDEESTESIRQRYFDSFGEKAFGGNIRDYQNNVRAIDGVGAVKVTPVWNGGGTVLLTILDAMHYPASAHLIDRVQEAIDPTGDHMGIGLAPIGHVVTVQTADVVTVDIDTTVLFSVGVTWEMVRSQVTETVRGYMLMLRQDWESQDIVTSHGFYQTSLLGAISQINSRILTVPGIIDVQNTKINGAAGNLEIDKYSIPVLGVINVD